MMKTISGSVAQFFGRSRSGRGAAVWRTIGSVCVAACLVAVHASVSFGQTPSGNRTSNPRPARAAQPVRPNAPRMSPERMIYQRAVRRAQHRAARIEARKWTGRSALRPTIRAGAFLLRPTITDRLWPAAYVLFP